MSTRTDPRFPYTTLFRSTQSPPVTPVEEGRAYLDRINAAVPAGLDFTPLIVSYLTDHSDPHEIARGHAEGVFTAAKLYPAHATTGSAHGVPDVSNIMGVLERDRKSVV